MTTLTGPVLNDFTVAGGVPATGYLLFELAQFDPAGVTRRTWKAPVTAGEFSSKLPDSGVPVTVKGRDLEGFPVITIGNYAGLPTLTLHDVLTAVNEDGSAKYLVNPRTLQPLNPMPRSAFELLQLAAQAATAAAEDAEAAHIDRVAAGTSAFNAGASAATAGGHADRADDAAVDAKAYRDEAIGVARRTVIDAIKTVSGDQYLVKLLRQDATEIDLGDLRGLQGLPGAGVPYGVSLGNVHLDTITASGVYMQDTVANGSVANGYPIAGTLWMLEVFRISNDLSNIIQRLTVRNGAHAVRGFYQRRRAGTWSAWTFVATQRVDQTAGRAIYMWDDINGRDQLTYGDTGVRNITDLFPVGGIMTALGLATVSRYGQWVELALSGLTKSAGLISFANVLPSGFRPTSANASGVGHDSGGNMPHLTAVSTGAVLVRGASTGNGAVSVVYRTPDAWPSVLPGTAAGTIPNL